MQKMMRQAVVNLRKHGDLRDLRLSKIGDSINSCDCHENQSWWSYMSVLLKDVNSEV